MREEKKYTLEDMAPFIRDGCLTLPGDMREIPDRFFDMGAYSNRDEAHRRILLSVSAVMVPGSVRRVGDRAFAECANLERVELGEGTETLGQNIFTGCGKLRTVRLAASITHITGWTFWNSGLTEPVFSADGKILVYYSASSEAEFYAVPEGVEEIGGQAFLEQEHLKAVTLPESLKRIRSRAFSRCGICEMWIPEHAETEFNAFFHCKELKRIHMDWVADPVERKIRIYRAFGKSILTRADLELPDRRYWKSREFRKLAWNCADGNPAAMDAMCDYFHRLAETEKEPLFYQCAEQFWAVRASLYGSERGKQYIRDFVAKNKGDCTHMVSPFLTENLNGSATGEELNALGFFFFKKGRGYNLSEVDSEGIVEVYSYWDTTDPDEDGFGCETLYDWWYLDDCLNLPFRAPWKHANSMRDKNFGEECFQAVHDQVVEKIRQGKQTQLGRVLLRLNIAGK